MGDMILSMCRCRSPLWVPTSIWWTTKIDASNTIHFSIKISKWFRFCPVELDIDLFYSFVSIGMWIIWIRPFRRFTPVAVTRALVWPRRSTLAPTSNWCNWCAVRNEKHYAIACSLTNARSDVFAATRLQVHMFAMPAKRAGNLFRFINAFSLFSCHTIQIQSLIIDVEKYQNWHVELFHSIKIPVIATKIRWRM